MAKSDAAICNIALQRVGVTMTIDKIDERTKEATVCNTVFETVRKKMLADAPWPFARKYQRLALSGVAPSKWQYSYVYPNDCLAVRALFPDFGTGISPLQFRSLITENKVPFEIATDENGGRIICTDQIDAIIEYTVDVSNVVRFDSNADSALAWGIAAEIALPLSRDVKYSQNAYVMYDRAIRDALAAAFNESSKDERPESEFIRARE